MELELDDAQEHMRAMRQLRYEHELAIMLAVLNYRDAVTPEMLGQAHKQLWRQIAPLFDRLDAGVAQCRSVPELERWRLDWGELSAALDEESTAAKPQSTTGEKP